MKRIYAISLVLGSLTTLLPLRINAQEIKKEAVYLLFKENDGNYPYNKGKKFSNKEGLNFNLYINYFIHRKRHRRDTLCLRHLADYKITEERELKEKEQRWRKENEDKLKKRHILYKQINRNSVFTVFIIEVLKNDKVVIYEVVFRNEGAID